MTGKTSITYADRLHKNQIKITLKTNIQKVIYEKYEVLIIPTKFELKDWLNISERNIPATYIILNGKVCI